jgi:hypothetical protein
MQLTSCVHCAVDSSQYRELFTDQLDSAKSFWCSPDEELPLFAFAEPLQLDDRSQIHQPPIVELAGGRQQWEL